MSKLQFVFTPTSIEIHDAHSDKSRDVIAVITPEELLAAVKAVTAKAQPPVVPADAVVVEWTTEPPKEDAAGWAEHENGAILNGRWFSKSEYLATRAGDLSRKDIARYLMIPRPKQFTPTTKGTDENQD